MALPATADTAPAMAPDFMIEPPKELEKSEPALAPDAAVALVTPFAPKALFIAALSPGNVGVTAMEAFAITVFATMASYSSACSHSSISIFLFASRARSMAFFRATASDGRTIFGASSRPWAA